MKTPPTPIVRDSHYAWAVAWLTGAIVTVAFIDRQAMNLLVDPIKKTLGATDTQVSLLQGAAIMVALLLFAPVFGRLVDVGNRRNILAGAVAFWSVSTMLCGLTHNFSTMFLARVGVGAAEAALGPACWSLLSDYFSERRLPAAVSIYVVGAYVGGGLSLIFGGVLVSSAPRLAFVMPVLAVLAPWQITFVILGAPGLILAVLILLAVREPPRVASAHAGPADEREHFTIAEVAGYLSSRRAFYLGFGVTMTLVVGIYYAVSAWMPSVLVRGFGLLPQRVGPQYGLIVTVMGCAGVLTGPPIASWLNRRGAQGAILTCVILAASTIVVCLPLLPIAPTYAAALILAAVITFALSVTQPLGIAALASATPSRMRGMVCSLYTLLISGFGLGVTPTLVAMTTDRVFHDPAHVASSLALVCTLFAVLAVGLGQHTRPAFKAAFLP